MKCCLCDLCFNPAVYVSGNSPLHLCEDCYTSMEDDYESMFAEETGMSFDEYYDFQDVEVED